MLLFSLMVKVPLVSIHDKKGECTEDGRQSYILEQ
jgi:hypothetical protein